MAYARLAIAQQWFNDWVANAEERKATGPLARANANKALALDPQSAVAMGVVGINQAWLDFDMPKGDVTLKQAVALDPTNAETLYQLADITACLGQRDESIAMMRKALSMEHLNSQFHFNMGQFLLAMGRIDEAEAEFRRAIDLQPTAEGFRFHLTLAYIKHGELDLALATANAEPNGAIRRSEVALAYFARGDKVQGQAQLAEMLRLDADVDPSNIAEVYAFIGDADQAFVWLDRDYATRDSGVTVLYEDPIIVHALRSDPRLAAFTRKLGVPDPSTVPDPWASAKPKATP